MNRTRDELAAAAIPSVKVPLWTRDYMLACCANLMMGLAFFELVPVLPLYLTGQLQVSSGWLGWIMSIYVLAAILSRPWFAHRVDSGDRKKIYVTVYILLALSFSGYAVAATALMFFATRFIQGLIWGGMTTSGPTMAVDIIPPSRRGEGLGFFGMTMTLGMCLGPVIGLQVYQQYGFYVITWSSWYCAWPERELPLLSALHGVPFRNPCRKHLKKCWTGSCCVWAFLWRSTS